MPKLKRIFEAIKAIKISKIWTSTSRGGSASADASKNPPDQSTKGPAPETEKNKSLPLGPKEADKVSQTVPNRPSLTPSSNTGRSGPSQPSPPPTVPPQKGGKIKPNPPPSPDTDKPEATQGSPKPITEIRIIDRFNRRDIALLLVLAIVTFVPGFLTWLDGSRRAARMEFIQEKAESSLLKQIRLELVRNRADLAYLDQRDSLLDDSGIRLNRSSLGRFSITLLRRKPKDVSFMLAKKQENFLREKPELLDSVFNLYSRLNNLTVALEQCVSLWEKNALLPDDMGHFAVRVSGILDFSFRKTRTDINRLQLDIDTLSALLEGRACALDTLVSSRSWFYRTIWISTENRP
jgi:hypothetical protein